MAWRSCGPSERGCLARAGLGSLSSFGRRQRYSAARETPRLKHSGAVGTSEPTSAIADISRPLRRPGFSGGSPGSRALFLDFDDHLGLLQLPLQARDLLLLLLHSWIHGLRLRAALARSQRDQGPLLPLAAPRRQQRGVQTLAPQQRPQLARRLARVRLPQDLQPVLGAEAPALRLRHHLGVRGPASVGGNSGRPTGSLRFRRILHLSNGSNSLSVHPSTPPRPYTNLPRPAVSRIIGTGGNISASPVIWVRRSTSSG